MVLMVLKREVYHPCTYSISQLYLITWIVSNCFEKRMGTLAIRQRYQFKGVCVRCWLVRLISRVSGSISLHWTQIWRPLHQCDSWSAWKTLWWPSCRDSLCSDSTFCFCPLSRCPRPAHKFRCRAPQWLSPSPTVHFGTPAMIRIKLHL